MARNREAYHEYFVEEEIEAGIELVGTEVKSIRAGTLNLKDAWCGIKDVPHRETEFILRIGPLRPRQPLQR